MLAFLDETELEDHWVKDMDEVALVLIRVSLDAEELQKQVREVVVQGPEECGVTTSKLRAALVRQNVISMKYPVVQGVRCCLELDQMATNLRPSG